MATVWCRFLHTFLWTGTRNEIFLSCLKFHQHMCKSKNSHSLQHWRRECNSGLSLGSPWNPSLRVIKKHTLYEIWFLPFHWTHHRRIVFHDFQICSSLVSHDSFSWKVMAHCCKTGFLLKPLKQVCFHVWKFSDEVEEISVKSNVPTHLKAFW